MARCPIDGSYAKVIYLRDDEIPGIKNPLGMWRPIAIECESGHVLDAVYEYNPELDYEELVGFRDPETGKIYTPRQAKFYERGAARIAYYRKYGFKEYEALIRRVAKMAAEEVIKIETAELAQRVLEKITRLGIRKVFTDRDIFRLIMDISDAVKDSILNDPEFIEKLRKLLSGEEK